MRAILRGERKEKGRHFDVQAKRGYRSRCVCQEWMAK